MSIRLALKKRQGVIGVANKGFSKKASSVLDLATFLGMYEAVLPATEFGRL